MKKLILAIFSLFLLYQPILSSEIKKLDIACPEWEGYTNKDGTGAYWEVVKTVFEPAGIKVKVKIVPWNRALYLMKSKSIDALVGDYYYPEKAGKEYLYPRWHLSVEDSIVTVFKTNKFPNWNSEKAGIFENHTIGWIRGYGFEKTIFKMIKIKHNEISKLASGLKMLDNDRIDAIVDYRSTILPAAKDAKINLDRGYQIKTIQLGSLLYVIFSNTARSRTLLRIWDNRMDKLVKNGKIKQIYGKWGHGEEKFGMERYRD